jgi:hypothetical protein
MNTKFVKCFPRLQIHFSGSCVSHQTDLANFEKSVSQLRLGLGQQFAKYWSDPTCRNLP